MFSIPIIVTLHAPFFYQNEVNPVLFKLARQVDQICPVSKWALDETEKLIPASKDKLRLVYNGLPMPTLAPTPLCFSSPTLLMIGRFTSEKGFATAIRAFSLVKHLKAQLFIIGKGENRPFMEELVDQLGLRSSVHFVGALTKNEIPSWINRATLVLVPSYFESFGLVALEAMQMGRPVIASAVGGLQEIIVHEKTGLLIPPHDPVALSSAIEFLLKRKEIAIEMGNEGRKRAQEMFTLKQNVEQYEEIYRKLR